MANGFVTWSACLAAWFSLVMPIASAQILTDEHVAKVASPLVQNKVVDGLSIGYIEGDHYGIVHLGNSNSDGKKADNLTVYELGSISKVFTSLLLADAVVRGEIELKASANFANAAGIRLPSSEGRSIAWIDLSTHRSGLPRLPENFDATSLKNPYRNYDSKKAAAALQNLQLARQPGAAWEYSNLGVSVLGYLIAEKSAATYQQLLRERIAKPLGMSDCTVDLTNDQKKRFATPHDQVGSPTLAWMFADMPGAGGVHATMRDMMRFAKAQLSPPPGTLGKAIELAWKQHRDADASGAAMGLGWMVWPDGVTRWHNGQTGGSHSSLFINRGLETAIIVLCNTAETNRVDALAIQLLQTVADQSTDAAPGVGRNGDESPPKVSPFTSVGIHNEKVFVTVDGKTYLWLELDEIKVKDIVASSKKQFGGSWQKRIREDLVEVLWGMGHKPGGTVKLRLQDFKTKKDIVVENAPMTKTNRDAIRAEGGDQGGNELADQGDGHMGIDAELRGRLVGRYKVASFIFDVEDREGHLMVRITGQQFNEVYPDSPTRWSYRGIDAAIEFKLGRTGPARSLVLHQNGIQQTARRIGR